MAVIYLAKRLISAQDGLDFALLLFVGAVVDLFLPVASLLLDIESQTCGATDSLQTLESERGVRALISGKSLEYKLA